MRESLAKLKAALEQEKRLNSSIKQKKVFMMCLNLYEIDFD